MVFGLHVPETRTANPPLFSFRFNGLQKFPKLATSSTLRGKILDYCSFVHYNDLLVPHASRWRGGVWHDVRQPCGRACQREDIAMTHRKTSTPDTPPSAQPRKDPDAWTTGDEPMTSAQRAYLQTLCDEAGAPLDDTLTKAEAAQRIDALQQQTGRGARARRGTEGHQPAHTGDAATTGNLTKDPQEWKTGDEPMTAAQRSYLQTLCHEAGEPMDETLTKAQAAQRIDALQQQTGRGVDDQRVAGGRHPRQRPSEPGTTSHRLQEPEAWTTGDEPMTAAQRSYLQTLSDEAGEAMDETLTKAQASERIAALQQHTGRRPAGQGHAG
jgi:hypothetical protein